MSLWVREKGQEAEAENKWQREAEAQTETETEAEAETDRDSDRDSDRDRESREGGRDSGPSWQLSLSFYRESRRYLEHVREERERDEEGHAHLSHVIRVESLTGGRVVVVVEEVVEEQEQEQKEKEKEEEEGKEGEEEEEEGEEEEQEQKEEEEESVRTLTNILSPISFYFFLPQPLTI